MAIVDFSAYKESRSSRKPKYKPEDHYFTDADIEAVSNDLWNQICELIGNDNMLCADGAPREHHVYNIFFVTNQLFQTAFLNYLVMFGTQNINQLLLAIQTEMKDIAQAAVNGSVELIDQ